MGAFTWLLALTLRGTVVLSVALGLCLLLRRASAGACHRLLTATAVGLLLLPTLPWLLPKWGPDLGFVRNETPTVPLESRPMDRSSSTTPPADASTPVAAARFVKPAVENPSPAVPERAPWLRENGWGSAVVGVWLAGVLAG